MNILTLIFLSQLSVAKTNSLYPTEPRCPSPGTKEVWQRQVDRCEKEFVQDKDGKHIDKALYEEVCRCVANGLFYNPTCAELKKMKDRKFAAKTMFEVNANCQPVDKN